MHFDINSKSIRQFADRVVKAHPDLDKPRALEIAAHGFGYRNFDTLSGLLKDVAPKAKSNPVPFKLDKSVDLWVEGFVCDNDAFLFDWLQVELTPDFLANLLKRRDLCEEQRLLHVSEDESPTDWSTDDDLAVIHDWQLYVSATRFWFRGHPKHCSFAVESRAVYFEDLLKQLNHEADDDESFRWIEGALYKDSTSAQGLYDVIQEKQDAWKEPASKSEALDRLHDAEMSLVGESLDDDTRGEILDEIANLEDWLLERGYISEDKLRR